MVRRFGSAAHALALRLLRRAGESAVSCLVSVVSRVFFVMPPLLGVFNSVSYALRRFSVSSFLWLCWSERYIFS